MKFRYLGDKTDMVVFGCDFSNGNEPDVTDPHAIGKLSGNSHFEVVAGEGGLPTEEPTEEATEEAVAETAETVEAAEAAEAEPHPDAADADFPSPPKKKKG
jgi:hypothetical protein